MSQWATKRKLTYLSIFFGIAALLIGVPSFFILYEAPNCFDGKQNGMEQGVDCGGKCVKLCKPLELQPVVLWQQSFRVARGVYTAVAYVQNPNLNGEAFQVPYTFKLYNARNQVIAERTGRTYIPPGKNFVVMETSITVPDNAPVMTSFEINREFTWYAAKKDRPELVISHLLVSNASTTPSVDADINNPTFTDIKHVDVMAIVYDTAGNAFAGSKTVVDNFARQTTRHIVFTWPEPFTRTVSRVEIIPIVQ